jgi:hypothetical protein
MTAAMVTTSRRSLAICGPEKRMKILATRVATQGQSQLRRPPMSSTIYRLLAGISTLFAAFAVSQGLQQQAIVTMLLALYFQKEADRG